MTRATTCIFCDAPAGSSEHTILAALGGLRTDRGILCQPCNNHFGATIDSALVKEMEPINAIVGVMNGRTRKPISTVVDDAATGRTFVLTGGRKLEHPSAFVLSDTVTSGVRSLYALASTTRQTDDFICRLKSEGKPPKVRAREKVPYFFAEKPTAQWNFGSPETLRGIARLVLNIVASLRPQIARDDGLTAFKQFIRNGGEPVGWVNYAYGKPSGIPAQFDFSHRFVIMFDAARQEVRAQVSLLDLIEVSVYLGTATVTESETVIYEMDLLANSAPSDVNLNEVGGLVYPLAVEPTVDPKEFLVDRLARVLFKRNERLWASDAPRLLAALNATREFDVADRHDAIVEALSSQKQRLLNIAAYVAADIRQQLTESSGVEVGDAVGDAFALLVQPDATSRTGVSEVTLVHVQMLPYVMADHLVGVLNERPLESDELRFLLEGGAGAKIVGRYMMEQVAKTHPQLFE